MTRLFYSLLLAAVLTLAPVIAQAQVSVAVVDMQEILSDSAAARNILEQLKGHREKLEKEIKGIEDALKKEEQELIKQRETAKPEDFAKSRKAFEKKLVENREKVQKRRKAAEAAFNKAVGVLRENILKVVTDLAAERKIQMVVTKQNIIVSDRSLDITADVMAKLNETVKTIKVTVE
jgi:outer membrane protein